MEDKEIRCYCRKGHDLKLMGNLIFNSDTHRCSGPCIEPAKDCCKNMQDVCPELMFKEVGKDE